MAEIRPCGERRPERDESLCESEGTLAGHEELLGFLTKEKTPLGTRVLYGYPNELLHQPIELDLARDRVRRLHGRENVERAGRRFVRPRGWGARAEERREAALELFDLRLRPPLAVRVPRLPEEDRGRLRLPSFEPELPVELAGQGLFSGAGTRAARGDRSLVEGRRLRLSFGPTGRLRQNDPVLGLEVLGAIDRPSGQPLAQASHLRLPRLSLSGITLSRQSEKGQRMVEDGQLVPDRPRVFFNDFLALFGHPARGLVLTEGVEQGEPGDEIEHLEETLPRVNLSKRLLVEVVIGQGEPALCGSFQSQSPLEHQLGRRGEMVHFDPPRVLQACRRRPARGRQVPSAEKR